MARGKHFINNVDDVVVRLLRSLLLNDASLRLIPEKKVLYRPPPRNERKVILISGGGSGHEPAHAGYVGQGMLDVAVAGDIFASPSATQILAGVEALDTSLGALVIVKNYTGDKLNFGLAAAKARAQGRDVRIVIVEDDVSIEGNDLVGRRGLAGVVFVHKIAGAAAAQGLDIDQVERIAQKTADAVATVAASLDRCSVPNRRAADGLAEQEMEFGMGIHNEPGAERTSIGTMQSTVKRLVGMILDDTARGARFAEGPVAVLINNLGGLSVLETQVLADEVVGQMCRSGSRRLRIARVFVGTFVSSLDGPGFSISLLKLDTELLGFLDAPTAVNNWPRTLAMEADVMSLEGRVVAQPQRPRGQNDEETPSIRLPISKRLLCKVIESIAESVGQEEPKMTRYDTIAGDGDCGTTLLSGVNALVRYSTNLEADPDVLDLGAVLGQVAAVVEESMGGTSGAIYAIFLNAVSAALQEGRAEEQQSTGKHDMPKTMSRALDAGLVQLCKYTSARAGGRTMMDALMPFVQTFCGSHDITAAVEAAVEGAEGTRRMKALLGRASYVATGRLAAGAHGRDGIPDPGALGVVAIARGVVAGLELPSSLRVQGSKS